MNRVFPFCISVMIQPHATVVVNSSLPAANGDNFKLQSQFLYGLNRNWLNFVFKTDVLKAFLAVDRG